MTSFADSFRNLPIRAKVLVVTMTASAVAVLAVAGGLFAFQSQSFRRSFARDLETLASIMADNCSAAVAFGDPKTAAEVLGALSARPVILGAGVLDKDGRLFATFRPTGLAAPPSPDAPAGLLDRGAQWRQVQPITLRGDRLGTVYLDADFAQPRAELRRTFLGVTTAVLGASLALAAFLTIGMQRFIARPIQALASASAAVARERDYSTRVPDGGRDELGQLTRAFNHMLARIGEQDAALQTAHHELEGKVAALEREVAERLQAQQALAAAQAELVETSRYAGMAEIATGVLHNVGNVLNSVNLTASLALDQLRQSKADGLARAVALLREQNGHVAEFIAKDPRGQRLPAYLERLAGVLGEENTKLRGELESLSRNVEHIKEIVAMQQSYARVTGVLEDVPPARLLEDALHLNAAAFARHGIELVRDFADVPPVRVDKHKVLQILINLLRNAKHALEDSPGLDRRLTLRLAPSAPGSVAIVVQDNGIGIPAENLTRIFQHGFTTKEAGHGFGLHSGALAARELGGALRAESPGPGCGATFTLTLPATPPKSSP